MTECYECAKLAELVAENSQLRVKIDELTCNDALAPEKIVTPVGVVANDANTDSRELGDALNEVAEKWAIAQVEAEDYAKRCMLLEELVRDLFDSGKYFNPDRYGINVLAKRANDLGIDVNI